MNFDLSKKLNSLMSWHASCPPPSESVSSSAMAGAAPEDPADAWRAAMFLACAISACSAAAMHSCMAAVHDEHQNVRGRNTKASGAGMAATMVLTLCTFM